MSGEIEEVIHFAELHVFKPPLKQPPFSLVLGAGHGEGNTRKAVTPSNLNGTWGIAVLNLSPIF